MDRQELDSLVARHVWGMVVVIDTYSGQNYIMGKDRTRLPVPSYADDMAAAAAIEEKLESQGFYLTVRNTLDDKASQWIACFLKDDGNDYMPSVADELPVAICLAAVAAMQGKNLKV